MSDSWRQNAIAVTGVPGSGKSTVTGLLREHGAFTLDADELAREVIAPGTPGFAEVRARFGESVIAPDGSIDRKKLGAIVFSDPAERGYLESVTHPRIRELAAERVQGARPGQLVVYDVPLLFEANMTGFRKVIVVAASEDLCLERLMRRMGLSHEDAVRRMRSQLPLEEKRRRADIIIENEGSLPALRDSVARTYQALIK